MSAMLQLRPASDPVLGQLMLEHEDVQIAVLKALAPRRPVAAWCPRRSSNHCRRWRRSEPGIDRQAARLLATHRDGREKLIEQCIDTGPCGEAASAALLAVWPSGEAVFWRLGAIHRADPERRQVEAASQGVLRQLNQGTASRDELRQLAREVDEETAAQAKAVLADGRYARELGPWTFRRVAAQLPADEARGRPRDGPLAGAMDAPFAGTGRATRCRCGKIALACPLDASGPLAGDDSDPAGSDRVCSRPVGGELPRRTRTHSRTLKWANLD